MLRKDLKLVKALGFPDDDAGHGLGDGSDYSDIQLRTFITGSRLHFKKSISSSLWIFLTGIAESLRSLDHFKHWKGPCTNFSSRYQEQFRSILCFDVSYFFQHPSNFHLLDAGFVWPWLIWGGDQPIGFLHLSFPLSDNLVMWHHSLFEHGTREMIGYEKLCHGSVVNPLTPPVVKILQASTNKYAELRKPGLGAECMFCSISFLGCSVTDDL